ncbi:MAG: type II toxin-antitoxin system RelE/ParE family toxin [Niabella sp.]
MKNGYDIFWTDNAINELKSTIQYLEENFGEKELNNLANKIESTLELLSKNPFIFPQSEFEGVRRVSILKYNTLYYRLSSNNIEIVSFFSNRQHPNRRKI